MTSEVPAYYTAARRRFKELGRQVKEDTSLWRGSALEETQASGARSPEFAHSSGSSSSTSASWASVIPK